MIHIYIHKLEHNTECMFRVHCVNIKIGKILQENSLDRLESIKLVIN